MALTFVNGGAPDYLGFTFSTTNALLDAITINMINAGWAFVSEVIGSNVVLEGTSLEDPTHKCYIQFTVKVNSGKTNGRYLVIRGWHTVNPLVTASADDVVRLEFMETGTNRLWLALDQDAGGICIYASDGSSSGAHYGFLQRLDPTDQWAWYVGYITSDAYPYVYAAKSKHNGTNWRRLADDYYYFNQWSNRYQVIPYSTFDMTMWGQPYNHYTDANGVNAFREAYLGRLNYDGKALLQPYYYIEGRGANNNYGYRSQLYYRGHVKFAYTGLAAAAAADWFVDTNTTYRIMSVGGSQWQGMRIA